MRELLRSQEQHIIDRVILQLTSQNQTRPMPHPGNLPAPPARTHGVQPPRPSPTRIQIAQLEGQLAPLREEIQQEETIPQEARTQGTYNPIQPPAPQTSECASGIADLIKVLFPGVERGSLVQIIENRFKPTNIYRLLASEKERAESQRTISIEGVRFEQAEREVKESEYRMSSLFKAWAGYFGILVKLAPYGLQGDLATSLSIYTMNLYELLEKYAWEGVKAYHFQFHWKRLARGKNIYIETKWRQLDSELIASKIVAHPATRPSWTQSHRVTSTLIRRTLELPIRENIHTQAYPSGQ